MEEVEEVEEVEEGGGGGGGGIRKAKNMRKKTASTCIGVRISSLYRWSKGACQHMNIAYLLY